MNEKVYIGIYPPNTRVYAISEYCKEGKPLNYVAIYEAIVDTIYFGYDKKTNANIVEYWLKTPEGEGWGDCVKDSNVNTSFEALTNLMKQLWIKDSNSFGD